jgi:hypothetical protein
LQYRTLLCRIAGFALALVLLCLDKIEEAVHEYFWEVLPTESTPWGVIAMKKQQESMISLGTLKDTQQI